MGCSSSKQKVSKTGHHGKGKAPDKKKKAKKERNSIPAPEISFTVSVDDNARFDDQYMVGKKLGAGSFAVVHECTNRITKEKFAVKLVARRGLPKDDEEALMEEVSVLRSLNHTNIVKLYDFFEEPDHYYMVMEKMMGGELFDRIVQKTFYNEKEARDLVRTLLSALRYLHDGAIVHRDLKPENLLLTTTDDDADVKIADFGFCRRIKATDPLTTQCGTPGYVAPEILRGVAYGVEVDLWSMGVITYILLGGYPPFHDENSAALYRKIKKGDYEFHDAYWGGVSEEAKDLIKQLLTVDPNRRITAHDALQHPWIRQEDAVLRARNLDKNLEEFKRFNAKRKFRAAVRTVVAAHKMKTLMQNLTKSAEALNAEREASEE